MWQRCVAQGSPARVWTQALLRHARFWRHARFGDTLHSHRLDQGFDFLAVGLRSGSPGIDDADPECGEVATVLTTRWYRSAHHCVRRVGTLRMHHPSSTCAQASITGLSLMPTGPAGEHVLA